LDIASRETLKNALAGFGGTVVLVSHDRFFLDAVATRVVEIKDGAARSFPGNYTDYCLALQALGETSPLVENSRGPSAATGPKPAAPQRHQGQAPAAEESRKPGHLHREQSKQQSRDQQKLRKLVGKLEEEISRAETRLAEIEKELGKPEIYKDYTRSSPLLKAKQEVESHRASYMEQWERYAATLDTQG
jgi:ATP-binding cassette subfamily F protein 3